MERIPERKANGPKDVPELEPGLQEVPVGEIIPPKAGEIMPPELGDPGFNIGEFERRQHQKDEEQRRKNEGGHTLH